MSLNLLYFNQLVLFLCIKYSVHTRDKEHKGPILKHHFCLNLSKKQTFVTKVKNVGTPAWVFSYSLKPTVTLCHVWNNSYDKI